MAQVKTLAPYTVPSGAKVRLSEAQRTVRAHVPATETEDGWLIFGGALTFKAGEVFELESVPKGAALEIPDAAEPEEEQPSKTSGLAEGANSKEEQPSKTSGAAVPVKPAKKAKP